VIRPSLGQHPAPDGFQQFFRLHASGVALVTAYHQEPTGAVATSFCSVSRRPPLLLVCLTCGSRTAAAIRRSGCFSVHLLRAEQIELCIRFAKTESDKGKAFEGLSTSLVPVSSLGETVVVNGTLAWAACSLWEESHAGDHSVLIGHIRQINCSYGAPLVWHDSQQRRLAEPNHQQEDLAELQLFLISRRI
jgi:flavin reductase (DIM6/NTAB) family NADH-FMN oxidoreductase RutF